MAMPTFTMSCFRLPKTVCEALVSVMANYWWQSNENSRGIHWKSWKKISIPKNEGGLGFRDIESFNIALLGKQLWRMLNYLDSLLARVFKGRYFKDGTPLSARLGSRPSFAWRSLHSAQELLKAGAVKILCTDLDSSLDLWTDPWLPCDPPRPPRPALPQALEISSLSHIRISNGRGWNLERINEVIHLEDRELVTSVCVTNGFQRIGYRWKFNKTGLYSVKSAYWTLVHVLKSNSLEINPFGPSLNPLFKAAWKCDTSPKIRNFLWRCLSNNLAVAGNLKYRHMASDDRCARCGQAPESVNHLLFECPYAKLVWSLSPWAGAFQHGSDGSIFANFATFLFAETGSLISTDDLRLIPWILWRLWKARNSFVFSAKEDPAHITLSKASMDNDLWIKSQEEEEDDQTFTEAPAPNALPSRNRLKSEEWRICNWDGAWSNHGVSSGLGWVLWNSAGEPSHCGMQAIPAVCSALYTEAEAAIWTVECVARLGFKKVGFQTDCRDLILAIDNPSQWPSLASLVSKINQMKSDFDEVEFVFQPRKFNQAADALAGASHQLMLYSPSVLSVIPLWLQPLCKADMLDFELFT